MSEKGGRGAVRFIGRNLKLLVDQHVGVLDIQILDRHFQGVRPELGLRPPVELCWLNL